MADAAITFAVKKLGEALIQKVQFLKGVKEQVEWLKDELENMRCFLKDAAEKQGHDKSIGKWISDVREVAQDAEDSIEIFTLKLDKTTRKRDLVRKWAGFPTHLTHLNRIGNEIESIRTRLDEIAKRRKRYGIRNLGMESTSSRNRPQMVERSRRTAVRFQKDKDVVGLNQDADLLLNKVILAEDQEGLSLAVIVGMGGIGKSTLARKIYNNSAIAEQFEQRAWVVVSNEFEAEDIMLEIMHQLSFSLDPKFETYDESSRQDMLKEMRSKHEEGLKEVASVKEKLRRQIKLQEMLHQRLEGKRFFIVLDDVWEHAHWEDLKAAFPDEQGKASRLLFTSREEIFTKRDDGYIHKMRGLNLDESWELLLKSAFIGGQCPKELKDIGTEILGKCDGLPLAITVAGGLLKNHEDPEEWKEVLKQIKHYHSETSEIGKKVYAILELSYDKLPSHIKPFFLCLAFFKEDVVIRAKRLMHIWLALGFVQAPEGGEKTLEDKARSCLDELINRNLIQIKGMSMDDRVKYCYVHDLLRELSIKRAKEEIGFESMISDNKRNSSSSYKPRHRVVSGKRLVISSNENRRLRSLFLHLEGPKDVNFTSPTYWKGFELLRILDTEGSTFEKLPSNIRALIGLRYLRLREAVGELTLPSWLDVLKNLEVIDIADCNVVIFPDVTWRMDSLRHFYINSLCHEFSNSMKKSSWKNLETLKYVSADSLLSDNPIQAFSHHLRKLGVQVTSEIGEAKMRRLLAENAVQVLHLNYDFWSFEDYQIPDSLDHLTKLKLIGRLDWYQSADKFPQNITHLTLSRSWITIDDVMHELGKLPNLVRLKLHDSFCDYTESIKVSREGFPRLKFLHLGSLLWLKNIEIEEGGMTELQRLEIYQCPYLSLDFIGRFVKLTEYFISAAQFRF